jgi:hypothetical protein
MNLTDLSEVLRERAAVSGSAQQARLAGVRAKVTASRRRRAVAGAACVVLVLVGVVFAVVPRSGPSSEPAVPVRSFPEYQDGVRLIGQAWGELPSTSLTVRFTPTSLPLKIIEECDGGKDERLLVSLTINGHQYINGNTCGATITVTEPAAMGIVVGQPSEVTLTLLGKQGEVVNGVMSTLALPAEVTFGLGIGQGVPVADYPFPPRPQTLPPLEPQYPEGFTKLTADPADPAARKEMTFEWPGTIMVEARVNTPGRLQVLVNDVPVIDYTSWTYTVHGSQSALPDDWASSYGLTPAVGDPVRITVIPERITGDWEVKLVRRCPVSVGPPC